MEKKSVTYSFIIPFRDRKKEEISTTLESLRMQTIQNFEIIFVNYGSKKENNISVSYLLDTTPRCRQIYSHAEGLLWNRAHALNIGIKAAIGDVVILTDADMAFMPRFVESLSENEYDTIFTIHASYNLKKNVDCAKLLLKSTLARKEYLKKRFTTPCVVKRDHICSIGGIDEFYQVWGAEEDDLYRRLTKKGLRRRNVEINSASVLHQFHPSSAPSIPTAWYLTMVDRLYSSKNTININKDWGKVHSLENRTALLAYQNGSYMDGVCLKLFHRPPFWFNLIYQKFFELNSSEIAWFEYHDTNNYAESKKNRSFFKDSNNSLKNTIIRIFKKKIELQENQICSKLIYDFFEYFIGKNKEYIKDYYLRYHHGYIFLILQRK